MATKLNLNQNKSLGQHWLIDPDILEQISSSLNNIEHDYDFILEVGPGKGALTQYLLRKVKAENKTLIGVELDERMFAHLNNQYSNAKYIKLINANYLDFNEDDLPSASYIIIANLPYNISSPVFSKLIDIELKPKGASLLIQKEVAERMRASAGQKGCSPLSIKLNNIYETELGLIVPKSAFDPPPKVTSRIIKLKLRAKPLVEPQPMSDLMRLVNMGFKFRRKKLINNLSINFDAAKLKLIFLKCDIDPNSRAENLNLDQWLQLSSSLSRNF